MTARTWTCPACEWAGDDCGCGVDRHPDICGGRWRVRGTRLWIGVLEACRRRGLGDELVLEMYPHLGAQRLEQVWRWLDNGGAEAIAEERLRDLVELLAEDEGDLEALALTCATYFNEERFRAELARAADEAWRRATGG